MEVLALANAIPATFESSIGTGVIVIGVLVSFVPGVLVLREIVRGRFSIIGRTVRHKHIRRSLSSTTA